MGIWARKANSLFSWQCCQNIIRWVKTFREHWNQVCHSVWVIFNLSYSLYTSCLSTFKQVIVCLHSSAAQMYIKYLTGFPHILKSTQFLFSSSELLKSSKKRFIFCQNLKKNSKSQVLFLLQTILLIPILFNWLENSYPLSTTSVNQYYYQSLLRCLGFIFHV